MKALFFLTASLVLTVGLTLAAETEHNFKPKAGYVPDEKTAIAIAVAVWLPIYGEKQIESEKPFNAFLKDCVWQRFRNVPNTIFQKSIKKTFSLNLLLPVDWHPNRHCNSDGRLFVGDVSRLWFKVVF